MKEIPEFPKIIPELFFNSKDFLRPFFYNLKRKLVATFFYKPIIKNNKIYIKNIRTKDIRYMPLFNLSYGLAFYNDYKKTGERKYLELFKQKSLEIIEQAKIENNLAGWKFAKNVKIPGYPPVIESYSALFQGRGLSLLCRYYQFCKDKKVIEIIKGVLRSFETESDKGGVLKKEGTNSWYLEYSYGNKSPVVYNGFISSLISLYETSKYGPTENIRKKAKTLYEKGFTTLINNTNKLFNKNIFTWLRYDSNKLFFTDGDYYKIINWQIEYLAKETKNKKLKELLEKIEKIKKQNKWKANMFEWSYQIYKKVIK